MNAGERLLSRAKRAFTRPDNDDAPFQPHDGMDRRIERAPAWRRYAPYAIGAAIVLAVAVYFLAGSGERVYRVPVDRLTFGTVTEGPFEDFVAVRGAVAPLKTDYLTTDQGGTVKDVLVEDGAIVRVGQPIAVLRNTALELDVASREAEAASQINALENTELQLEETRFKYQSDLLDIQHQINKLRGNLGRDKPLVEAGALAPSIYEAEQEDYAYELRLQKATTASGDTEQSVRTDQLNKLKDTLARLNANVAAARASLDALTIRASMAGQLTALDAEPGQSKSQGAVLGEVDSLDRFKLTAQVDEFYLGRVVLGQDALFTIDEKDYRARVSKIYPQVANGTFKVDFVFAGAPPQGIHNGEAVDMKVELGGASRAIMLPNGPFCQDTGGNWAFVVSPDGDHAVRRNIRLGRRNPEFVEVLDGLKPGEKVIVSGYEAFLTMDRVDFEKAQGN